VLIAEVNVANITLAINEELLKAGREYAKRQNISLNALIRKLLERTVRHSSKDWLDECFQKMDLSSGDSKGVKWRREDLYDV
jgi:predicted ATP-dependent endonuclease of OLD family